MATITNAAKPVAPVHMKSPAPDSMKALKADIRTVLAERGPLRNDPWVRAHFWNRAVALHVAAGVPNV